MCQWDDSDPPIGRRGPVSRRWWMMSTLVVSNPPGMRPPVLDITDTHTDTWHDPHWTPQSPLSHNGVMKVPPIHLTQLEPDQELDLCDPSCHQTAPSDYTRPLDKNINWYNTHHHYTPQSAPIRRFLCLSCLTFFYLLDTWYDAQCKSGISECSEKFKC